MDELSIPVDGVLEFKQGNSQDCNLRSAILPYREREKYTIGDKFASWEAQGQLIFISVRGHPNWNFVPTSLVEISCEFDHFWVKPVEGNLVLKNGLNLDDKVRTRLNFGDELAFTKHRNKIDQGLAIFTFKQRTYVSNWDRRDKTSIKVPEDVANLDLDFAPDRNQLVFSHILSYLPVSTLKNARLVCTHWDEQVFPILRMKSAIGFETRFHRDDMTTPSHQFLRYVHVMRNVSPWPNWKIWYPQLPTGYEWYERKWTVKYIQDLNWFLHPSRGHHVKSLSLHSFLNSNRDYWLFLKPITQLKDTLEELRLDIEIKILDQYGNETKYHLDDPIIFKILKKFSLSLTPREFPRVLNNLELAAPWMKNWADAIQRVESISTRGCAFLGSRFAQELQNNAESYQNLKDIRLTCEPSLALNFLAELTTQTVTNLTLTIPLEVRDLPDFENLLKKFAPSLELLCFLVSTKRFGAIVLNLPCLPRLKKLDFYFALFRDIRTSEIGENQFHTINHVARFRLSFPPPRFGGDDLSIEYERHLPSIRGIVVKPKFYVGPAEFWDTYSDLFDSLLPKEEGQTCQTLQCLEIPTWDGKIGGVFLQAGRDGKIGWPTWNWHGYHQAGRLPKVFPNVRNEWMNELLEMGTI